MTCRQQSSNEEQKKRRRRKTKAGLVTLAVDVDLEAVAQRSEGLTAADLRELLSSAGMETLRKDVNATAIGQAQLLSALRRMTHGDSPFH
jgi:ATP-dependent 26S proteasome regulatory subunit